MKFNDFLIIDIGESFVFYSKLRFYADKGYKVISSKKSRIPKYIDISELVKEYESTNSQVFFLSNSFIDNNLSASSTFILNSAKYWKTNLAFLSKNLGLDSLGFLHISSSEIIFTNGREIKSFESDDLYWEFIRTNKSYLKKTGLDEDQLLNFLSAPPLPQQVTDYYKSFHISFKFVDFIFE
ncbi:MAG TPA: hypothetical protein VGA67_02755, partial [Candidatus Dojkabacteria bacterium]